MGASKAEEVKAEKAKKRGNGAYRCQQEKRTNGQYQEGY